MKGGEDFSAATFSISRDNRLVAGSLGHGILEVNIEGDQVSYHTLKKQDKTQFSGIHIAKVQVISPFVFVGTSGGGIKIFNSDSGENIELQPKYKEHLGPDIFALEADNRGRIWVGSTAGIFVLMDKASSSFLDEAKEQPQEFVAYIRSCTSLKDQSTVFGGAFFKELGGVQTLEASELNKPTLEFEKNSLRFSYSSSDLVNADIIEYQTYLEGFDQGWSDWSERTYREFTNLVWKDYTFHIRARRADGTVSKEAKFEFTILPPWYEQYWFYLLQLVILMIVFAIVVYVNGWTDPKRRKDRTKKLNNIIIGTIWGYSFSKIGVQGALWAFSGGAAFLAVITKVVMGIFLKPMQKKVEIKIVEYQINLVQKLQRRSRAIDKKVKKIKQFADQKVRPGCSVKKPKEATLLTAKNLSGRQGFSNRPKGFHSQRKAS